MSTASPLMLQNGIYLQTREYTHDFHLDKAHLLRQNGGMDHANATDLGMITPWITTGFLERPGMFDMIKGGANRIFADSHLWKWQAPVAEQPTYSLGDITNTDKPGQDGSRFKIKLNKRSFGNGAIIAVDKFSQIELYVTEDEIFGDDSSGYTFTVKLHTTNAKYRFWPKEWLTAGTIFFQKSSVMGEYGQKYNDMGTIKSGYREFYNYVGEGTAHVYFEVTRDAAYSKISENCVAGIRDYRKILEMYQFAPGSPLSDATLRGESPVNYLMKKGMTKDAAKNQVKQDLVKTGWVPEVEALAMRKIEMDVEMQAVWGAGGVIEVEGKTAVHMPIGLFHQVNLGSTYSYNIPLFNLEKLEAYFVSRVKDKIDPYGQNELVVGTGRAGLKLVRPQILERVKQSGIFIQDNERYIKGTDNQTLYYDGPNFLAYRWEFGIIKFVHVPALDPIIANDLENPLFGGERLSSYIFIIDDLSAEGDNVYEVVYGPDWDYQHRFINGKMNYLDIKSSSSSFAAFQSANNHPGFQVFLEKRHKAYWIKDITKSLLIKPINPRTGKPIFEPVFG
jgi:hypothetical protein